MDKPPTLNEEAIAQTIDDFESFCRYVEEQKPVLSKRRAKLGKYDLFELNGLLHCKKDVAAPNFQQESYPAIDLMFKLALLSELYIRKPAEGKRTLYLTPTVIKEEYDRLNVFEKYVFLFEIFWCLYDLEEILRFERHILEKVVQTFASSKPGKILKKGAFSKNKNYDSPFGYKAELIYCFHFFGLCRFTPLDTGDKKFSRNDDAIEKIIPTELGVHLCRIMKDEKIEEWNIHLTNLRYIFEEEEEEEDNVDPIPFHPLLAPLFPEKKVQNTIDTELEIVKGNYIFKVFVARSVWRRIKLSHEHTLLDLHNAIQKAFKFDDDHLYSFYMDNKRFSKHAINSPNSSEGPYVDEITIGELGLYEGKRFLYLFDFGDNWEFSVQLEKIDEAKPWVTDYKIIEKKGKSPEQYKRYDYF